MIFHHLSGMIDAIYDFWTPFSIKGGSYATLLSVVCLSVVCYKLVPFETVKHSGLKLHRMVGQVLAVYGAERHPKIQNRK